MKIVVTGVAGLLGSRFADWVIENIPDVEVIGIDDLSGGYIENVHPKVKFYKEDISTTNLEHLFADADLVYHFAAYAAECLSPFIRSFNYTNNLVATSKIVNYCISQNVKRLVFTSSISVYGVGNPPFHEDDLPRPIDPYGVAKFSCEQDIRIAGEQHGLDWCILRPHNVYGVKQNIWDKYRNVLGIWMYQHLNNQPMTIFGDGSQSRAFSYIDDCLECMWKAGIQENCSKEIINLGGTKYVTIKEANDILKKVIGGGETIHYENRHEVKVAHSNHQKSIELLGYQDKHSLEEGITAMWNWARTQKMRDINVWGEYEIDKNIYEYWRIK